MCVCVCVCVCVWWCVCVCVELALKTRGTFVTIIRHNEFCSHNEN